LYTDAGDGLEFAVQSFADARPNGIYKEDYLKDLSEMFESDEELVCPGRPEWEEKAYAPYNFGAWKAQGFEQHNGHGSFQDQPSTSNGISSFGRDFL
jgi:hypothetical protein